MSSHLSIFFGFILIQRHIFSIEFIFGSSFAAPVSATQCENSIAIPTTIPNAIPTAITLQLCRALILPKHQIIAMN